MPFQKYFKVLGLEELRDRHKDQVVFGLPVEGTDSDIVKDQFLYLYGEWGSAHIFFLVMVLVGRARRAGVFDFGMGRVLYLQKNLGTGMGRDR